MFSSISCEQGVRASGFVFSPKLRRLRAKVNKLYRWFRKSGSQKAKVAYLGCRYKFKNAIMKARRDYSNNRFSRASAHPSQLWKLVNGVCGRGRARAMLPPVLVDRGLRIHEPQEVAEVLKRHFSSVGRVASAGLRGGAG